MSILDLITLLIFLAAVFTLINITVLKLPSTIGLMAIALGMSVVILPSGWLFPSITGVAESIVEEFDFQEVLLNVMLNFLLFAGALSINLKKLLEDRNCASTNKATRSKVRGFNAFLCEKKNFFFAYFGLVIEMNGLLFPFLFDIQPL